MLTVHCPHVLTIVFWEDWVQTAFQAFSYLPALAQLPSALTSQLSLSLETQFQHHLPARPSLTLDLLESYSVVVSD